MRGSASRVVGLSTTLAPLVVYHTPPYHHTSDAIGTRDSRAANKEGYKLFSYNALKSSDIFGSQINLEINVINAFTTEFDENRILSLSPIFFHRRP